ncbi:hypothetical protein EXN66_Car009276 [Channa argus]|uniref:Uncharacterized protein n=1 Tax=Channa argus TaxID=215402 RepID=A0A6G1PTG9_CHAAH|nr:hypothetical protein EXN66_Car009276 [Channa argus]KAK2903831.1 hypothetical protein Q8A73_010488 [Channa argus]
MSSHGSQGAANPNRNLTNPVVIQPVSGLPWTAQPTCFLCQQLRAALCLRTSPLHHSQKTQSRESMSSQSQFSPQARSASPHSLFSPSIRFVTFTRGHDEGSVGKNSWN